MENQVVLITGGAGGVGRELAIRFAEKNAVVVIWDLNAEGKEKWEKVAWTMTIDLLKSIIEESHFISMELDWRL